MKLVLWPDPILTQVCLPVADDTSVGAIVGQMSAVMREHGGCGIAAPQIGVSLRLFVLSTTGVEQAFINPVLISKSPEEDSAVEGCLSLPGAKVLVARPRKILVEWTGLDRRRRKQQFMGLTARAFLHELDHLDGILITDRGEPV